MKLGLDFILKSGMICRRRLKLSAAAVVTKKGRVFYIEFPNNSTSGSNLNSVQVYCFVSMSDGKRQPSSTDHETFDFQPSSL